MVRFRTYTYAAALFLASAVFFNADAQVSVRSMATAGDSINRYMSRRASVQGGISVDTVFVHSERLEVNIRFGKSIADYPLRDNDLAFIEDIIRRYLPEHLQGHSIYLTVRGDKLERLSSGFYSGRTRADISKTAASGKRWVTPVTHYPAPDRGLAGRNIALWAGHGYYYSGTEDRWKWQRAPFFSTIEDLLPHSYLTGFLAPMLENAGAGVIMPRERDSRRTEIVIDNGDPFYTERNGGSEAWTDAPGTGFALPSGPLMPGDNPFRAGTARMVKCNTRSSSSASYLPRFPETGDYAVYVSYKTVEKSSPALYTVRHSGGDTRFVVDQSFGGGTWVYLGTFRFSQGETGQGVIVQNSAPDSPGEGVVTTDAVKFGGGMGNVLRGEETSGFPRYAEAGRYWMQWSGFPEEVYSLNEGEDDYRDDFMSRGEWVNSLIRDFHIPIDLALALHTDAGSVLKDSIVGTLAIYKEESEGSRRYSDGTPRITARELSDIVQTSIVEDIRAIYRPDWTRRAIWDRSYMEARVPDVPTVLIELLSHQNFADMECALDPEFQFIVSRAIYKGILKYLSYVYGTGYTVQPLPVKDFSALIQNEDEKGAEVRLRWVPEQDPTEPTAIPDSYIVYRRTVDPAGGENQIPGFDKGVLVTGTEYTDRIEPGRLYSYKIVAVNRGGLSFPSEILSAGYIPGSKEVLVVNGFTSVSAPASLPAADSSTAGFDFKVSHGIPYVSGVSYIGEQYEFNRRLEWIHDDRPGFGASFMDYGPGVVAGNTFDFPLVHGLALMRAGISLSSSSSSYFLTMDSHPGSLLKYSALDILYGKESGELLTKNLRDILAPYLEAGGALLISGSNIGKTAHYHDTHYPLTSTLLDAASDLRGAAYHLAGLRDSLRNIQGSGEMTADIEDMMATISELYNDARKNLSKGIDGLLRESDPAYIADGIASDLLGYGWSNGMATSTGNVRTVPNKGGISSDSTIRVQFNISPNPFTYCVESADAILPSDDRAFTFMRYEGSNTSAAVAYDGQYRCVSLGFPIEALTSQQQVDGLMCEVMRFLLRY